MTISRAARAAVAAASILMAAGATARAADNPPNAG
jgi:hypothetical protein